MTKWLVILLLLLPTLCHAGSARRFFAASASTFTETGDTGNFLSQWQSSDAVNGTTYYYTAEYNDPEWNIWIYNDDAHTTLLSHGYNNWGSNVLFTGATLNGSVWCRDGGEANSFSESGTIIFPRR